MTPDLRKIEDYLKEKDANLFSYAVMNEDGIFEINTGKANPLNNSYSCTKSFAATAIGLLWDENKIGLDEPVTEVLKGEYDGYADPKWEKVLVRHALSHTMGIDKGYLDIDVEDIFSYGTDDFLSYAFSASLPHEPGRHYQYSDAAFYIVSRLVENRSGEKMDEYLMRKLLYPMRVQEAAFSRCPKNHPIGATGLYIRSSDMVKLGFLYANGGALYGQKLLSEDWIKIDQECGFAFQKTGMDGLLGKGGMLGQFLMYSPEKKYAVAWHSYTTDERLKGLYALSKEIMESK
ncbi:MAG: beta-lactamase family protein [Clostridia bacterium]|nr:beta-lactamase family protein [Clostridia bacterium]